MFKQIPTFLRDWYGPADHSTLLGLDQLRETPGLVEKIYARHLGKGLFNRYQTDFHLLLTQINCQQAVLGRRLLPCTTGESIAVIRENYDVSICEMTHPIGNLADFGFDLRRLLYERFDRKLRQARDVCYCSNSCNNSSSILTGRMS
jgi:hypothetical protein